MLHGWTLHAVTTLAPKEEVMCSVPDARVSGATRVQLVKRRAVA